MTDASNSGLGDLFALFGSTNPLASIGKSIEQWKRGVNEFLNSVETFNTTMQSLNEVAMRVTSLLDEVEEPIRALMPQMTRSIKATDALITQISGPIERVAPGLNRLADTLASPVFAEMPVDIGQFLETLKEVSRRMQPLTQVAETASSLFGLRSLTSLRSGSGRSEPTPAPPPVVTVAPSAPAAHTVPAKKAAIKPAPAKKAAAKKAVGKKPAKRATHKKAAPKKRS